MPKINRSSTVDAYFADSLKTCTDAFDDVQKKGGLRRGSGTSTRESLGLNVGAVDVVVEAV